ncbi:MAG: metal-dependent hydrolase [Campylobacterales bacterium]|nr:metal-dependent hydrolase [Campylobacterales bacterium]
MTYKGHLVSSLMIGFIPLVIEKSFHTHTEFLTYLEYYLAGVIFGSIFPDIDEPNSYVGRKALIISNIIKAIFGHRGVTHYLIIPIIILICAILFLKNRQLFFISVGFSIGYIGHILADMLTKGGIYNVYFPFKSDKSYRLLPKSLTFYTGSFTEYIVVFFFFLILSTELYFTLSQNSIQNLLILFS